MGPAAGTATNQFDDGVRSKLGFLDLALDLWFRRHKHLSCLIWRQGPVSGSFLPVTWPLRGLLGEHLGLADWALARLPGRTLNWSIPGWAAAPLTTVLGPKLSDLLTNLLL